MTPTTADRAPGMALEEASTVLAALAQTGRLQVVRLLVRAGSQGITAGSLAEAIGIAPNTMSVHLKQLQAAKLILSEREGRSIRYRISFDRLGELLNYLLEDCCAGAPEVAACCASIQTPSRGRRSSNRRT
ncbi:MAG: helix-turn-helix transcriptional regulator [Pseudomonadota bacterium]